MAGPMVGPVEYPNKAGADHDRSGHFFLCAFFAPFAYPLDTFACFVYILNHGLVSNGPEDLCSNDSLKGNY